MREGRVTAKGRVTIPANFSAEFGIEPGHRIVFFRRLDGRPGIHIIKPRVGAGRGSLKAYAAAEPLEITRDAIGEAVAEGVAERWEGEASDGDESGPDERLQKSSRSR